MGGGEEREGGTGLALGGGKRRRKFSLSVDVLCEAFIRADWISQTSLGR